MGFGGQGRMQRSMSVFVFLLSVTCLASISECWTLESSISSEEKNFMSKDLDIKVFENGDRNIIEFDDFSLQTAAGLEDRVEENDGGSHKISSVEMAVSEFENKTVQSKSDDGDISRKREATLDRFHKDNSWCGAMRSWSNTVFGFQLHDEQDSWPDFKLTWRTVSAIFLGGCGAALSSAGGLGGGALFVSLFNLLLQFDTKTSAALSNFMILGGSLANLYINLQEAHPFLTHKPLIDFDVVVMLQPNMLLGISIGVILNVVLPDWVITLLLTITLFYMSQHSFKCGLRRWKKETYQNRLRLTKSPSLKESPSLKKSSSLKKSPSFKRSLSSKSSSYVLAPDFHHDGSSSSEEDEDEESTNVVVSNGHQDKAEETDLTRTEDAEALHQPLLSNVEEVLALPWSSILTLALTWLAFFVVQVVRGNQSILGVQPCGVWYWLITATQIPIAISITAWTIHRIHAAFAVKEKPESQLDDGFVLEPESCIRFAWMALMTGVLGGLLGLGGGMIINPILLTFGMIPQVTAATCASMVFFSSSMSVVQFWLMGRVPIQFALSGALICAISSFVGISLLHRAIAKYNRASLIVFSVTSVMVLSALLMTGFGGAGIWHEYNSGAYMGFHYPC